MDNESSWFLRMIWKEESSNGYMRWMLFFSGRIRAWEHFGQFQIEKSFMWQVWNDQIILIGDDFRKFEEHKDC